MKYIKHPFRFIVNGIIIRFLLGWLVLIPIAYLIPKKRKLVVFLPRYQNRFADNVKYLFLHMFEQYSESEGYNLRYICENKALYNRLNELGLPVAHYPSLSAIWTLLRADVAICDSNEWIGRYKYHLTYRAYKIQLWHGAGIKNVGVRNPNNVKVRKHFIYNLHLKAAGKLPRYELLTLSSERQIRERTKMFQTKDVFENGLPRNDFFFKKNQLSQIYLAGTDKESLYRIRKYKDKGTQVVLYSPTWRNQKSGNYPFDLDFVALNRFCCSSNVLFIIKDHPSGRVSIRGDIPSNVVIYNKRADVYPLLPIVDLLITDFSSIYSDFLLLNRPILFYYYNHKVYPTDQLLIESFENLAPGEKCYNQVELHAKILEGLYYPGKGKELREKVLKQFHSYNDGHSSKRLCQYLRNNGRL